MERQMSDNRGQYKFGADLKLYTPNLETIKASFAVAQDKKKNEPLLPLRPYRVVKHKNGNVSHFKHKG